MEYPQVIVERMPSTRKCVDLAESRPHLNVLQVSPLNQLLDDALRYYSL
jgi:hypothetical protein